MPVHPPNAIAIKNQITIPVQQLMMIKNIKDAIIAHIPAPTKIGHPDFKLKAIKL